MYSEYDDLTAGFPHSEICGSKRVCSLPAAYRKLLRPSSPDIAKASTMCTYSLVPITLASLTRDGYRGIAMSVAVAVSKASSLAFLLARTLYILFDLIQSLPTVP